MLVRMKGRHRPSLRQICDAEFVHGQVPTLDQLFGGPDIRLATWQVVMLTGLLPDMSGWPLRHRKEFQRYDVEYGVVGCNLFRDWDWGWFKLGVADGSMVIDYDMEDNGRVLRGRIRDHLRTTLDPNMLIGRFYVRTRKAFRFAGFFHLVRLQPSKG